MPCAESEESEHKKAGAVGLLLLVFLILCVIEKLDFVVVREFGDDSVFVNRREYRAVALHCERPFDIGIYLPEPVCDYRYLRRKSLCEFPRGRAVVAVVSDLEQIHLMKLRQK